MSEFKKSSGRRQTGKKNNFSAKKEGKNFRVNPNNQKKKVRTDLTKKNDDGKIRLNKYISNSGVCSRREADVYIESGNVMVNGKVITEMGFKVSEMDEVRFDNTLINPEEKRYVLLNKPKNTITTMDDERGRKTVMELVANAAKERIYPVGRLDRNTTGLLLFTNDGELAKKLTHPKHKIQKLYHATLDKKLSLSDLHKIGDGFVLEDRRVIVDEISYIEGVSKNEVGIKIHSGRNRIVRKIFDHFGYTVTKLDRVVFAGLTKKNLPRGQKRHLTGQEVNNLKML